MGTPYNRLAGRSIERLAALSDGVFAVAMTLLVLDLHTPAVAAIHGEGELWRALATLAPRLLVYMMSFMTLGIFWMGQQTQLNHIGRGDRNLSWIHLCFLFAVTLMPFSTGLIGEFVAYRGALLLYWANILLLGLLLLWSWRYAATHGLVDPAAPPELGREVVRRIIFSQTFYAVGAALCVIDPYVSLGCILVVQLNYVLAPRLPWMRTSPRGE